MHSLKNEKNELRRSCAAIRNGMPTAEKEEADRRITRIFLSLSSYRFASLVLLHAPIKSEIDVWPILKASLEAGQKVALPLCEKEPGVMTFRLVDDPGVLLPGAFGVMEPPRDAPILTRQQLAAKDSIMAVPALAFDKKGYRLGYGKGYYDRFLADFGGISAGLVYRELLFDSLPRGFYDRRVHLIISESGVMMPDA
ncbi:MAG: 5-formyltetrahydrofolate cyclo-ligase [Clostridia bacterium]|nr:5-formyltetrahydrofolate cyclo-ligase [Clostridia bacterium]